MSMAATVALRVVPRRRPSPSKRHPPERMRSSRRAPCRLSEKLRCLVCQNQTIADSNAELAQDLRRQIHEQIAAGKTDDEIIAYMVARYGDFVLYQPPVKSTTMLLWAGPALLAHRGIRGPRSSRARATRGARNAAAHRRGTRSRRQGFSAATAERISRDAVRRSIAVAMVAIALAWVLVPVACAAPRPASRARLSNVAILRDQLRELDADLAAGTMPRDRYEQAKQELLQRALEESRASTARQPEPPQSAAWTAAILGSAIPIAALLLYVVLGNHDAFSPLAAQRQPTAPSTRSREPTSRRWRKSSRRGSRTSRANVDGWVMLARTYQALDRPADVRARVRPRGCAPSRQRRSARRLRRLARRPPRAASAASRSSSSSRRSRPIPRIGRRSRSRARRRSIARTTRPRSRTGRRMKATVPPTSPLAGSIDASIAEARELGGMKAAAAPAAPLPATPAAPSAATACAGGRERSPER